MKQEIQVNSRHQADNDKSANRVHNHVVDSNKLQIEMDTQTPPTSPINGSTNISSTKSKIRNAARKVKIYLKLMKDKKT